MGRGSIRRRDTLIAAVISALILIPVAVAGNLVFRHLATEHVFNEALSAAVRVTGSIRDGSLTNPIPPGAGGIDAIQVVGPDGVVIASSAAVAGEPPLCAERPPPSDRVRRVSVCGANGECYLLMVVRLTTAADSPVVYAGREVPPFLSSPLLEVVIAAIVLALIAFASWVTWRVVGRTLRPVEAIRAQLAEITVSDLSRRVPQPTGDDEIAGLASTVNATLDRLQRSVEQQRRFASDASHELRTPIAGLRAELEGALMHPSDSDLLATINAALSDTDRLEAIVTDLLLLARLGTGGPAVHAPVDLVGLVAAEVAARPYRVPIHTRLDPAVVTGTEIQLARLVTNLLDNADRHAESRIDVEVRQRGEKAVLTVTDDGAGIGEEDRERVFERFTRLDAGRSRDAGGTGLGLAIARDIAVAHHGSLRIEDSPRGARFVLCLPIHKQ